MNWQKAEKCKYCSAAKGSGPPIVASIGATAYIYRDETGAYLVLNDRTTSKVKIKACPICGEGLSV